MSLITPSNLGEGFDAFLECRIDWIGQPYFPTHNPGQFVQNKPTATLDFV